jgi:hypothetical protein
MAQPTSIYEKSPQGLLTTIFNAQKYRENSPEGQAIPALYTTGNKPKIKPLPSEKLF